MILSSPSSAESATICCWFRWFERLCERISIMDWSKMRSYIRCYESVIIVIRFYYIQKAGSGLGAFVFNFVIGDEIRIYPALGYNYCQLHVVQYLFDKIREDLSFVEEHEAILDRQERVMRKKTIPIVKVLWKNHPERDASWKNEEMMRSDYPHFFLRFATLRKLGHDKRAMPIVIEERWDLNPRIVCFLKYLRVGVFEIREDLSFVEEHEAILDRQERVMRKKTIPIVKVLWKNQPERDATWKNEEMMRSDYPHFFLRFATYSFKIQL
ncbi:hypothetical protein Tco_0058786 [Tanacetum coccineum]